MKNQLNRFIDAQKDTYDAALNEIRAGHKLTHWIWFIFPQIDGLGMSSFSKYYGIKSVKEADDYYYDPVLGKRLIEITKTLYRHNKNIIDIMGSDIDAVKLQACMTLFYIVSNNVLFLKVLKRYFKGKFHAKTLILINRISQ